VHRAHPRPSSCVSHAKLPEDFVIRATELIKQNIRHKFAAERPAEDAAHRTKR
jgi:hypothetical protein